MSRQILEPGQQIQLMEPNGDKWAGEVIATVGKHLTVRLSLEAVSQLAELNRECLTVMCCKERGVYQIPAHIQELKGLRVNLLCSRQFERVQRRQFFRLPWPGIYAGYRLVATPEDVLSDTLEPAEVRDLSGGGAALLVETTEALRVGLAVRYRFRLLENEVISVLGHVVRFQPLVDNQKLMVCSEFNVIDENDRDSVIGYLLSEQARRIKKTKKRARHHER